VRGNRGQQGRELYLTLLWMVAPPTELAPGTGARKIERVDALVAFGCWTGGYIIRDGQVEEIREQIDVARFELAI
jgi:hypothetical protein